MHTDIPCVFIHSHEKSTKHTHTHREIENTRNQHCGREMVSDKENILPVCVCVVRMYARSHISVFVSRFFYRTTQIPCHLEYIQNSVHSQATMYDHSATTTNAQNHTVVKIKCTSMCSILDSQYVCSASSSSLFHHHHHRRSRRRRHIYALRCLFFVVFISFHYFFFVKC